MFTRRERPDEWREVETEFYSEISRRMVSGTVWALFDADGRVIEFDELRPTMTKGTIDPYAGAL
jgi:hypothetical protein